MNEADTFRTWLQNEMRRRQMSQRMLGHRAGINHSTISRILAGSCAPSLPTAMRLAAALGSQLATGVAQGQRTSSTDSHIRWALFNQGLEPDAIDEMLAAYRRRRMRDVSAG